jgi:hypothetical protein
MPLNLEEKKNIRRQLIQDLGRKPTDKEYSDALMQKFPEAFSSAQSSLLPPPNINPFSTDPLDYYYADPSKKRIKVADSASNSSQIVDMPESDFIDQEFEKEKKEGKKLLTENEKSLNLKPFSVERPSGTAEDMLALTTPKLPEKSLLLNNAFPDTTKKEEPWWKKDADEMVPGVQIGTPIKQPASRSPASATSNKPAISSEETKAEKPSDSLQDDEFKRASEKADYNQAQARLMSAIGGVGTAFANLGNIGTPIENKFKESTDDLLKHAADPISRLKDQRAQYEQLIKNKELSEDRDPKSPKSIQYRQLAKSLGMVVKGNETASDFEKVINPAIQKYQSDESKAARVEAARIHAQERIDLAKEKLQARDADKFEKAAKYMEEDEKKLNTRTGKEISRYTGGLHALSIVDNFKDLNKVPEQFKRELAVALASMISPGIAHKETIDQLDPKTLQQTLNGYLTKLTGTPYGAGAAGTVKLAMESIKNQMNISANVLRNETDRKLRVYKKTLSTDAYKELEDIAKSKDFYRYSPENFNKETGLKKVTLKDGESILVRPEDLEEINKDDILKVE